MRDPYFARNKTQGGHYSGKAQNSKEEFQGPVREEQGQEKEVDGP